MKRFLLGILFGILLPALADAAQRRALVIGIDNYENLETLKNARADAERIATTLARLGFQVTVIDEKDTRREELQLAFANYFSSLYEGDESVVFYSGHGVEVSGANFLVPKNAPAPGRIRNASVLPGLLIPFADWIAQIKRRDVHANVWIIDACRNNPYRTGGKALGSEGGLASMNNPAGTFVFYSAAAGQTALDRLIDDPPQQKNSVYTREFAKMVDERSYEELPQLGRRIRPIILKMTGSFEQRPSYYDDLDGPWCFGTCPATNVETELQTAVTSIKQPSSREIADAIMSVDPASGSLDARVAVASSERTRKYQGYMELKYLAAKVLGQIADLSRVKEASKDSLSEESARKLEQSLSRLAAQLELIKVQIAAQSNEPPIVPEDVQPNAVFLGKLSAVDGCRSRNPGLRPFGCELLAAMASKASGHQDRLSFLNQYLRPITEVTIRLRAPAVQEKRGVVYSCVVRKLSYDQTVKLTGIIDIATGEEVFYWGTVAGPPQPCAPVRAKQERNG